MNRAVAAARELRRVPGLRQIFESTDPRRRVRRILDSGLVDTRLYALQQGRDPITDPMTAQEAVEHYVRWGHWAGLSINPLLDDRLLRPLVGASERPPAFDYLWTRAWTRQVSPFWDAVAYAAEHPDALDHASGPVGHLWERVQADPFTEVDFLDGDEVVRAPWSARYEALVESVRVWGLSDLQRRNRRLSRKFRGVDSLGQWPPAEPKPLVSIVLASWNRAGELRQAIESVLDQTWSEWELVVVDDGSWDDTALVAGLLAERDPRIRYLPSVHVGVSAARNIGIDAARGDYLAFIDSDNTWEIGFLEAMMIGMREGDDAVAYATLELEDENRRMYRENQADMDSLSLGNVVDLNTLVVRRDAVASVTGFDTALQRAVDYDFILRLAQHHPIRHVPILGAIYRNQLAKTDRISTSEPLGWNTFVRVKNLIDWDALTARELRSGTSMVVIIQSGDLHLDHRLSVVRELAATADIDIHLALIMPTPGDWLRARLVSDRFESVSAHMFAVPEPYSYVVTAMLAEVTRERLVVVEPSALLDAHVLTALADSIDPSARRMVAPLLLHRDGTLVTIGASFVKPATAPVEMLSRHPVEDAAALGTDVAVPALSGRTFGMPTRDLVAVGGLDSLLYNEYELPALSLRLRAQFGAYESVAMTALRLRRARLVTDFEQIDPEGSASAIRQITATAAPTDLTSLYAPLGLRVDHYRSVIARGSAPTDLDQPFGEESEGGASSLLAPRHHLHPVVVRDRRTVSIDGRDVPRLRWALRIGSPAGPVGESWGDTHFARSLARGLESLGQEVVIDHHEVIDRPTAYLDDVTLVLRGLDDVKPVTGGLSMIWVISHPDQVTRREISRFDLAFAASLTWSRTMSERWSVPIAPLLQCTDPGVFHPRGGQRGTDFTFVGNSRGVPRPSVVEPIQAGIPVRVFGDEWERMLPAGTVERTFVPQDELSALYEQSGLVLNDHWNDMRRDGFIANRLFDVVAAGGRAFSDDVEGIEEIFGGAVQTFHDSADLVASLQSGIFDRFPAPERLREISDRIRAEHSFEMRARTLLDMAVERLGDRGATTP